MRALFFLETGGLAETDRLHWENFYQLFRRVSFGRSNALKGIALSADATLPTELI